MIDNIFHSAALKLTLWYLGIMMLLSFGFSVLVYHFAANELVRNDQQQEVLLNEYGIPPDFQDLSQERSQALSGGLHRIRNDLFLLNLTVLVGGGFISYYLARRTLEPIEEALDAQKRFTGDASHELRTPLTIIQTENEVALRNKNLSKTEAVGLLKSNLEEVGRLKTLSDGLLKLASFDNNQIDFRELAIKDVVNEASNIWAKAAAEKKIKLNTNVKPVRIRGDKNSLVDAVSILIDNAIKYSPAGTQIKVTTGKADKLAVLSVADQGEGIKQTDLPHIFERFYRADQARSKKQVDGYGLGLAIAKKIVELHHGRLEVQSTPGQGSIFTVKLPSL